VPYADTLPIPEPGEQQERRALRTLLVHTPADLADPFASEGEALNLTHFDDVVSSAWFERRMGYVPLTPAQVAKGPTRPEGAPAERGTLTVLAAKTEGASPGFTVEDAKGDVYIVKLDVDSLPHLHTSAAIIGNRLTWAAGYHVPEDYLMAFDASRLVVGEDAQGITDADVQRVLARSRPLTADGRYVALASRFVPGVPKGPFYFSGRREDDPNDHYLHEFRRELRGLQVVSSWINNSDVREGNTMDVYVESGYLRHYIMDLGMSLGSGTRRSKAPKEGVELQVGVYPTLARLLTLGFYQEGWEEADTTALSPELGYFRSEGFEPGEWVPNNANPAFSAMTGRDAYWAAKIVAGFTDAHIRAVVEEGGLPRPELEDTIVRILSHRRDAVVDHWFRKVSPVEKPEVLYAAAASGGPDGAEGTPTASPTPSEGFALAFIDLGLAERVWTAEGTRFQWSFRDDARARRGSGISAATPGAPDPGRQVLSVSWEEGGDNASSDGRAGASDLAVLELRALRPGVEPPTATIWLRIDDAGRYRAVGLAH
jgi:hypothetical protein